MGGTGSRCEIYSRWCEVWGDNMGGEGQKQNFDIDLLAGVFA